TLSTWEQEKLDPDERHQYEQSLIHTCYYHRDHQNSILSLTDKEGKIIESYSYDAYGNITHHTKTLETYNPYGYTGRETDTDDLYYYRARYYDPTLGRFITPDPIGFAGGDTNFYRYVGNDPVNFVDPSGLFAFSEYLDLLNPTKNNFAFLDSDTSVAQPAISNSNIPKIRTAAQIERHNRYQAKKLAHAKQKAATKGGASSTTGAMVNGNVEKKVDEKCKDQTWHDPIDNPQLAKYNINGVNRPWSNTFGMVRIQNNHPKKHQGVDLFALPGTPVYACVDGTISASIAGVSGYGNVIVLKAKCPDFVRSRKRAYNLQYAEQGEMEHGPNFNDQGQFYFMYAHLLERIVDMGAHVKAGQIIGKIGTSGYTTSKDPHLHFEISNIGQIGGGLNNKVNPAFYVGYKLPNELTSTDSILQNNVATSPMDDPRHGDPSLLK
ncbi:MAG: peptidoglycan DD-metalloendopeptidase family protein, partial [Sulfuricurvum sp.]|uniref:RHS repeat-associated core domain-containing protein n=1 Tax=Sulfuricurvum sp. TaxID=2025608 RepID=UPI00262319E3